MKLRLRTFGAILAASLVVVACGQSESETSGDRDRNRPIGITGNVDFGVNGNGVAVNPLWERTTTRINDKRTITLANKQTVYTTMVVSSGPALFESSDLRKFEFQVARVNTSTGQYTFDKAYGLKTVKLAQTPTYVDNFIPTTNGYGIHVINPIENGAKQPSLVRYRLDDRLIDTAFGVKGTLSLPSLGDPFEPGETRVIDVADNLDGQLFVLVANNDMRFLLRMNTKGVLDASFGEGGKVMLPATFGELRVDSLDRILIMGESLDQSTISLVGTATKTNNIGGAAEYYVIDFRIAQNGTINTNYINSVLDAVFLRSLPTGGVITSAFVDYSGATARELERVGYRDADQLSLRVNVETYENLYGQWEVVTRSVAISSAPNGRALMLVEKAKFEDRSEAFSPDETFLQRLTQFATNAYLYQLGEVSNRASNFYGLAVGRESYGWFDLYDVLRVTEYQSADTLASNILTSADGSLRFTLAGFAQKNERFAPTATGDIGLAQVTWGVAMSENGLPIDAFGGKQIWTKNPVTIDYLSSFFASGNSDELMKSLTLMGDDNSMYLVQTKGDGYVPQVSKVSLDTKTIEDPVVLTSPDWFLSGLPPSADAMEIRDGFIYITGNFNHNTMPVPWIAGVARYALSDGAMDQSYGLDGVVPAADGWTTPVNRILYLHDDGSFHLGLQYLMDAKRTVNVWRSPDVIPDYESIHSFKPRPVTIDIPNDVYSDGYTNEGPIGYTVDSNSRLLVARIRWTFDPVNGSIEYTLRVWRYLPSGQLDESFGEGGRMESDVFGWARVEPNGFKPPQISITKNDKILIGLLGDQLVLENDRPVGIRSIHVMARLMPNGVMDALKAPQPTPIPVALLNPDNPTAPSGAIQTIIGDTGPQVPNPAAQVAVPIVETLDPAPVVIAAPTPVVEAAQPTETTQASGPGKSEAPAVPVVETSRLKIIAMTSAIDRSIGVKWAIPPSLVDKNVSYEVIASPGAKACTTASTLCVF
ncbi:MAG: hypothetical protein FGM42_05835, partial [Ilumatobacteraceae bacterium]|nr:hypothetical protein [Ilumatobacteraceae bacterium]